MRWLTNKKSENRQFTGSSSYTNLDCSNVLSKHSKPLTFLMKTKNNMYKRQNDIECGHQTLKIWGGMDVKSSLLVFTTGKQENIINQCQVVISKKQLVISKRWS